MMSHLDAPEVNAFMIMPSSSEDFAVHGCTLGHGHLCFPPPFFAPCLCHGAQAPSPLSFLCWVAFFLMPSAFLLPPFLLFLQAVDGQQPVSVCVCVCVEGMQGIGCLSSSASLLAEG